MRGSNFSLIKKVIKVCNKGSILPDFPTPPSPKMTILKTRKPARFVCDLFVMMDADEIEFKPLPLPSF